MWAWTLIIASLSLFIFFPPTLLRYPLALLLGFGWTVLHANWQLQEMLPPELADKPSVIIGTIHSIPERKNKSYSFIFKTEQITSANTCLKQPFFLRLTWYYPRQDLQVGEKWQLQVKLKKARGSWNPGGFDYQKWLFAQGISATGTVSAKNNILLGSKRYFIDKTREALANAISASLKQQPLPGLISALAVGVRDRITEQQWAVLRGTGTNHLFAIAGLHIGFVTSIIHGLVSFLWRRSGTLALYLPTPQAAALAALIAAVVYSALAGFALPTQRAVIMTTVFLMNVLWRKSLMPWSAWCIALFFVLLLEPLAILTDSFWLSFCAVAFIIYGIGGRIAQKGLWWHWGRAQWVMALGLIPLCLLFFQQTSIVGVLANIVAVPWVGFIVLPLTLLGNLFWIVTPSLSSVCWYCAEVTLEWIWPLLKFIAAAECLQWRIPITQLWILISAFVAVIFLLAPRTLKLRSLGLMWGIPLFLWIPAWPKEGEVWLTVLDAGQSLTAVVQTQHHVLIYDAATKSFDRGNTVVIPFLRTIGARTIDTLILNHTSFGLTSLLQQCAVKNIFTNSPEQVILKGAQRCQQGQSWCWDNVLFRVLYPPPDYQQRGLEGSCVLQIERGSQKILVTGNINAVSQNYLLQNQNQSLLSTLLIAPQQGSKNSSMLALVNSVHPNIVLFATGNSNAIAPYQVLNAKIYTTAEWGALTVKLTGKNELNMQSYKTNYYHFWNL